MFIWWNIEVSFWVFFGRQKLFQWKTEFFCGSIVINHFSVFSTRKLCDLLKKRWAICWHLTVIRDQLNLLEFFLYLHWFDNLYSFHNPTNFLSSLPVMKEYAFCHFSSTVQQSNFSPWRLLGLSFQSRIYINHGELLEWWIVFSFADFHNARWHGHGCQSWWIGRNVMKPCPKKIPSNLVPNTALFVNVIGYHFINSSASS